MAPPQHKKQGRSGPGTKKAVGKSVGNKHSKKMPISMKRTKPKVSKKAPSSSSRDDSKLLPFSKAVALPSGNRAPRKYSEASKGSPSSPGFKSKTAWHQEKDEQVSNVRKRKREGEDIEREEGEDSKKKKTEPKFQRKHHDLVEQSKLYWEQIRDEGKLTIEERKKMIEEFLNLIKGKMIFLINKHDGSRIIQSLLKHGDQKQRSKILTELKEHLYPLSKGKYSKFLVLKLIKYASNAELHTKIVPEFYGKVVELVRHKEASVAIEKIYNSCNNGTKSKLVQEFYSREYALFKTSFPTFAEEDGRKSNNKSSDLQSILKQNPEKKEAIIKFMTETLTNLINKEQLHLFIVHRVFYEFYKTADDAAKLELSSLLSNSVIHLIKSKPGTFAAASCVSYSSPKDRKKIIKTMKKEVHLMCQEEYGHVFVLRLLDVVDDTVLLSKSILSEMTAHLSDLISEKHGRLTLLHILSPLSPHYFPKETRDLLQPTFVTDTEGKSIATSKKDGKTRRKELLGHLSEPLLTHLQSNCKQVLCSMYGSAVVLEAILNAVGSKQALLEQIVGLTGEPLPEAKEDDGSHPEDGHVLTNFFSSRVINSLLKSNLAEPNPEGKR